MGLFICPLGGQACPVADELERLREECRRLQALSNTDPLTGLFNLRHLFTVLETEMERTRRTGLPLALVMSDLDHFKGINDTYGHEAGNKALRGFCDILRKSIRRIDIPFRYGGEEFAVILPGTYLPQAVLTAERLRSAVERADLDLDGHRVRLTASFGVDACGPEEDISVEDLVKRTDRMLLEAKRKGRNRVCHPDMRAGVSETEVTEEEKESLLKR